MAKLRNSGICKIKDMQTLLGIENESHFSELPEISCIPPPFPGRNSAGDRFPVPLDMTGLSAYTVPVGITRNDRVLKYK